MKKIILLLSLIVFSFAFAQNNGHIKGTRIQKYYLLDNNTKLITIGKFEIILWDLPTKNIVWKKSYKEFGLGDTFYVNGFSLNSDKSLMMLKDYNNSYFIELKENKVTKWPYREIQFTSNNHVPVIINSGVFEKNDTWLVNPKTGDKIKIGDKNTFNLGVSNDGNIITMTTAKNKTTYYDIVSQTYSNKNKFSNNAYTDYSGSSPTGDKVNNYYHEIGNYNDNDIEFGIWAPNGVKTRFYPKFAVKKEPSGGKANLVLLDKTEKKIHFVEDYSFLFKKDEFRETRYQTSYTIYSLDTGELLYSLDLINQSNENEALVNAVKAKENARMAEETRIMNAPENVLKRRLSKVQGYRNYVYNTKTKGVYMVVPDKPLYEGNLVRLDALNDDPKFNMEVYEKLENLENPELYKASSKPKSCSHCNGKGAISNSYKRTAADYEYTTGKKLIETTTNTYSCGNCGGCGLVPVF